MNVLSPYLTGRTQITRQKFRPLIPLTIQILIPFFFVFAKIYVTEKPKSISYLLIAWSRYGKRRWTKYSAHPDCDTAGIQGL